MLLKHFGYNDKLFNVEKEYPLHTVCRKGHADIFDILLSYGGNINEVIKTDFGNITPLSSAVAFNRIDIIDRLLNIGLDIASNHFIVLKCLYDCQSPEVLHRLFFHMNLNLLSKNGSNILSHYIYNRKSNDLISATINLGVDVNNKDKNGMTPLIWSKRTQNLFAFKALTKANAL